MDGNDWAYERLVKKARNGDKHQTRELAAIFTRETIDACYIMALYDMDFGCTHTRHRSKYVYKIVADVCRELLNVNQRVTK